MLSIKEIVNLLAFDARVEDEENNTVSYYFLAANEQDARKVLDQYYKDDEFEMVGCAICIDQNLEKKYVENTYLIPHIESEGQIMEMFPVTVKLEEKLTRLLLKKAEKAQKEEA